MGEQELLGWRSRFALVSTDDICILSDRAYMDRFNLGA
jgi:hypothetical protein